MSYSWVLYRNVSCICRNMKSIRIINRCILPGLKNMKDKNMVKNIYFFKSFEDLIEIYLSSEDYLAVMKALLDKLMHNNSKNPVMHMLRRKITSK